MAHPTLPVAGVNLLVGTENGLMLLDRSGQGKVYGLIGRRRFQQMDVLEGLNLLITISGACAQGGRWGWDTGSPGPCHPSGWETAARPPARSRVYVSLREKEQTAGVLPVLAPEQNPAQRPRSGEEAGLDHRGGHGGLWALPRR